MTCLAMDEDPIISISLPASKWDKIESWIHNYHETIKTAEIIRLTAGLEQWSLFEHRKEVDSFRELIENHVLKVEQERYRGRP